MSSIPASELVSVVPSVLDAGGNNLATIGLVLTTNPRVPIGQVLGFPSGPAVSSFFGPTSKENTIANGGAGLGSGYFGGFTGATQVPGNLLFAQYPANSVSAYLRGGNISALQLATLQGYNGQLIVTIDGVQHSANVNLAAATSFTTAAQIIATDLGIEGVQAASFTGSIAGNLLNVTAVASGALGVSDVVSGSGVVVGTYIQGFGTGSGGTGTYLLSNSQIVGLQGMIGYSPAVQYDSVSGAFVVNSGSAGAGSTMSYGGGAMATNLLLTQAAGAVLSQGAAAATPAAFMSALVVQNSNWVAFMTAFNPDAPGQNTVKQAFAAWKNSVTPGNRFVYVAWDTDVAPTESVPATSSLGYILEEVNDDSGTFPIWEPTDLNHAAFVLGAIAAVNFNQTNGRTSFAYRIQSGLVAGVTDPTTANNLAGSPQTANFGNFYNFVGAYGSATASFTGLQRGTVTGPYGWLDSYVNQIWLNYGFQQALLNLLQTALSIPYGTAGNGLIEASLMPQIQAGLNFGAFGPGTISASQVAEVNNMAGANIAGALQSQGYYLQILPAAASVKAARTSPPMTFWYIDNQSVQSFNLASIALN